MECRKNENLKDCTCSYHKCPRKGMCCLCVKYHREKGEIPGCFFSEKIEATYDRSIENFLKDKNI